MSDHDQQDRQYFKRSPVLIPVAHPVSVAWVPVQLAALNIVLHVVLLVFTIAFVNVSPVPFFTSMAIGHIALIFFCNREPHLFTVLKAHGQAIRHTKNIAPVKKGVHLVP